MNEIQLLDCTLRDGGYCNEWKFGQNNIFKIISKLDDAGIDIIECGFLTHKNCSDRNLSRFGKIEELGAIVKKKKNAKIVLMANYGEYDFDSLPQNSGTVDGIRIAFHKDNCSAALECCKKVKEKGYMAFIQPMVSLRYDRSEFLELIESVNYIKPYAFYIVDSFGSMKRNELEALYNMADDALDSDIALGFHAHNNMQLARANAEWLIERSADTRNILIDSSVCGMGRGAGNLNTELMAEYLNSTLDKSYDVKEILEIIDEVILDFYEKKYWGYSLPNFLSAKYNVHPNYADYLEGKKTLTFKEMCEIFEKIPSEERYEYNAECIGGLYLNYLENRATSDNSIDDLKEIFEKRNVLLVAPGKTVGTEKDKIQQFIKEHESVVVSVNFDYEFVNTDYVFFSNIRRFRQASIEGKTVIATSNIEENVDYTIPYKKYLNKEKGVEDNAALMLIKILIDCDVKHIYIAGLDGYTNDMSENYMDQELQILMNPKTVEQKNFGIKKVLSELRHSVDLDFITTTKQIRLEK